MPLSFNSGCISVRLLIALTSISDPSRTDGVPHSDTKMPEQQLDAASSETRVLLLAHLGGAHCDGTVIIRNKSAIRFRYDGSERSLKHKFATETLLLDTTLKYNQLRFDIPPYSSLWTQILVISLRPVYLDSLCLVDLLDPA
jgi:hypothetical protein